MRWASRLSILVLCLNLQAQTDDELQKALQNLMLLMEKSASTLKEFSQDNQPAVVEEESGFELYYKVIKNAAKIEKRNDLLIKTQIQYRLIRQKEIHSGSILVLVHNQHVELFGKVHSKKEADRIIDIALHTKGVRSVTSYLIVKKVKKVLL